MGTFLELLSTLVPIIFYIENFLELLGTSVLNNIMGTFENLLNTDIGPQYVTCQTDSSIIHFAVGVIFLIKLFIEYEFVFYIYIQIYTS